MTNAALPESDAEIRLFVELAAVRAENAAAKAYAKTLEQQITQMSKSYARKLAGLQSQISSYEAEIEEKAQALEATAVQQRSGPALSEDDKEMLLAREGLVQRLFQATERMY